MTPNIFSAIAENDEEFKITSRESFLRKAAKKMKEIERLKEKGKYHSLTKEECEKLAQEDFWEACLYEEPSKSNIKEERKRKKEEEKLKKQEVNKKREEEFRRAYEENKKKLEEEHKKREEMKKEEERKRLEEERKRKFLEKKTHKKIKKDSKGIEDEYKNLLLLHNGNNDKTFRILSLKYHPDKNVGRQIWASEMQKQLGEFREKYSCSYTF